MSCDDYCMLSLSTTPMDPSQKAVLASIGYRRNIRDYFLLDGVKTNWTTLKKGEYYFIEFKYIQLTAADHATVSVEIEDPLARQGHFHSMRMIQRMMIG